MRAFYCTTRVSIILNIETEIIIFHNTRTSFPHAWWWKVEMPLRKTV